MKELVKTVPLSPPIHLGDLDRTADIIIEEIKKVNEKGPSLVLFPELSLTGPCLGDLYGQDLIRRKVYENIEKITRATKNLNTAFLMGFPEYAGYEDLENPKSEEFYAAELFNGNSEKIYASMGLFYAGRCLHKFRRKEFSQAEKYYLRAFSPFRDNKKSMPHLKEPEFFSFEMNLNNDPDRSSKKIKLNLSILSFNDFFRKGPKNCQDLSRDMGGAGSLSESCPADPDKDCMDIICLPMAVATDPASFFEWKDKSNLLTKKFPGKIFLASNAGRGQSGGDFFFGGESWISRNGEITYEKEILTGPVSLSKDRIKKEQDLDPAPLIPKDPILLDRALEISARGLGCRLEAIGSDQVWLGFSGGLDSTLAFLIALRAFDIFNFSKKAIHLISMPAFGTSKRTRDNAAGLGQISACDFREIPISDVLRRHFKDMALADDYRGVAFENAQARERTQLLMDLANYEGGMVIGTGDMSEAVLGWSTYGGDHLSMYQVNSSFPKTMVRSLVTHESRRLTAFRPYLEDILKTPISPELLPAGENERGMQKSEDSLGPYELHDFFIYHALYKKREPEKIYSLAKEAFRESYDKKKILDTLEIFYRRFINSQFKRSCMPDGLSMGKVNLSPRGGLIMPSDMKRDLWQREIDRIRKKEGVQP